MQINLQDGAIRGSAILSNGKMIFCNENNNAIAVFNSNGKHDFEINLNTEPCDIAYIERENTIAVTSSKVIDITDLNSRKIKRSIKTSSYIYGITSLKNTLVYCKGGTGILEMEMNDESEKTLVNLNMPQYSYVAVHGDHLYYTNRDNDSVTCYDIQGNLNWIFKDIPNMKYPQGISVDSNGNLYVAFCSSHSVVVITPDGKHCRQILSANDGLIFPRALHFERKTNKLLVANQRRCALLYDVS